MFLGQPSHAKGKIPLSPQFLDYTCTHTHTQHEKQNQILHDDQTRMRGKLCDQFAVAILLVKAIFVLMLFAQLTEVIIHAEHVVHRRGYCFHFGCMYVCMFVCLYVC